MPRIFDNIELPLLPILKKTLEGATRADFCVGYFNLRGWRLIAHQINQLSDIQGSGCRLLVGMQALPGDEVHAAMTLRAEEPGIDNSSAIRLKRKVADEFRTQLMIGAPSNEDEEGLRRLSTQLRLKKLTVKLYLRHPLHAKLYLIHRPDLVPIHGFVGSSNLTLSGLARQGELNVDVLDFDAALKLQKWFDERWSDRFSLDITDELADLIDESWAREDLISPYYIYLKIAYHLSQEARAGLAEYRVPHDFNHLFNFQKAAVQIAAHHVNKRGGVLIGDVVGLGKTLVGTALARILQEDAFLETLIICPKNLVSMWQDYVDQYRLIAKVLPLSNVLSELPSLRRYRVVMIDESHNLRNSEGKRYRAIQEYIAINESKCILLTATPYNKTYLDLSAQLKLFIPEDKDLGIRPEMLLSELGGELEFKRKYQVHVRSLTAFDRSTYADDWRDLIKLYMVRRTRSFIKANYAREEHDRKYLEFADGRRSYFPARVPKTVKFAIGSPAADPYALLYSEEVVQVLDELSLPRYGLGNYVLPQFKQPPTDGEHAVLKGLSRAGRRLMGFCRTNLFKRLESSGLAFLQSLDRHVLRNYVFLHAIAHGLELPIGTQDAELLDTRNVDADPDSLEILLFDDDAEEVELEMMSEESASLDQDYRRRAAAVYQLYATRFKRRFKWLRASLFNGQLKKELTRDVLALSSVLRRCRSWNPDQDQKLAALVQLLEKDHPDSKVLLFTQFADTAHYLGAQLQARGMTNLAWVTGSSIDPTAEVWRFSPDSNHKRACVPVDQELRVLIATDVLSEGQNLQDCAVIVNYDLPWAIIRLIQRAGRVDRIGQQAGQILCYSFLPAEGLERLINLRERLRRRLKENAEVVGTDEAFFEDGSDQIVLDLYHEKSGILDDQEDLEVDLTSEAFQIWKNATDGDPALKKTIEDLPNVVYATRPHSPTPTQPEGVLVFLRTADSNDALTWVDRWGQVVTQSQLAILKMAACSPNTPGYPRFRTHHELVTAGAKQILEDEKSIGGQLGRPSGARFRTYERLKQYAQHLREKTPLLLPQELLKVLDEIYRYPLRQSALDTLNRQLKSGIHNEQLAELVLALRMDERLCVVQEESQAREPQIICSMGLFEQKEV